uniref:Tyrosine-protein phosphatase domain-containing protein n=2 Tax=Caenorhabditis tropicalis TaxID=1561998 RepID=A0A1I7UFN4_9PELO
MLCNFNENKKYVCDNYFPMKVGQTLVVGGLEILCKEKEMLGNGALIKRKICISSMQLTEEVVFTHYQCTIFPPNSAPKDVTWLVHLLFILLKQETSIIHCTDGAGRSGTLAFAAQILQKIYWHFLIEKDEKFSFEECLNIVRDQRFGAVDGPVQVACAIQCAIGFLLHLVNVNKNEEAKFNVRSIRKSYEYIVDKCRAEMNPNKPNHANKPKRGKNSHSKSKENGSKNAVNAPKNKVKGKEKKKGSKNKKSNVQSNVEIKEDATQQSEASEMATLPLQPQGTAQGTSQGTSQGTAQGTAQGAAQGTTQGTAQGTANEESAVKKMQ